MKHPLFEKTIRHFSTVSVQRKLLLFIVVLMTLIITSISALILKLVTDTFIESEQKHLVTLSETISPKIGVWYFINKESNPMHLKRFLDDILTAYQLDYIAFFDHQGLLVCESKSSRYLPENRYNIVYQQSVDNPDESKSKETLGRLKIVYNEHILEDLSSKFYIVGIMLGVLLALYFYLEMRLLSELLTPLKKIASKIKGYLPGDKLDFDPVYKHKDDVIAEIVKGFLHMQHNIDDAMKKKEIEEENNRIKDALILKQARFTEMGMMINNIAHQWKQPLNIIELCIADLSFKNMMGQSDIDYQHKLFDDMHLQIEFMSKTLDIFKNFLDNNQSPKTSELFSLKQAIEDSIQLVNSALDKKNASIDVRLDETAYAYGAISEIEQVIIILINNALDANSTKITIECTKEHRGNTITIHDNGGGLNPDVIEHVFDAYFTTKHPSQGTGLGLFIAKMVIETKFNGTIGVSNTANGALFTIFLPDTERNLNLGS